jgi:hypothetical protein
MKNLTFFLIYFSLSVEAMAAEKVVQVDGASLGEIAERTQSGMATFYRITSLALVVVGFALFAASLIRLIKTTKGEVPNGTVMQGVAGMLFSAMLASSGFWLFVATRALQKGFTQ